MSKAKLVIMMASIGLFYVTVTYRLKAGSRDTFPVSLPVPITLTNVISAIDVESPDYNPLTGDWDITAHYRTHTRHEDASNRVSVAGSSSYRVDVGVSLLERVGYLQSIGLTNVTATNYRQSVTPELIEASMFAVALSKASVALRTALSGNK